MRVGAIDIGSNSVRLLTVDEEGREIRREVVVTGLASGVDATGLLSDASVTRTLSALDRYAELLDHDDVDRVAAVATSACRDAENGEVVMDAIAGVVGVKPEIISGDREAALAFRGATGNERNAGSATVVDIGGGSTEIITGGASVEWSWSYDIGSVRLTDRVISNRPASPSEVRQARIEAERVFASVPPKPASGLILGVAGTFTSLSAITLELERYDRTVVHGARLTAGDIDQLEDRLAGLSVDETAAIPSLDPRRAPVILAGAIVAGAALRAIDVDGVIVSEHDLLDGLAASIRAGEPS